MLVEFIGCSGAGKSSLRERVETRLRLNGVPVVGPFEVLFGSNLAGRIRSSRWANLLFETGGRRWTLAGRDCFASCDRFVREQVDRVATTQRERLRLIRSWNRKLAVHRLGRQSRFRRTWLLHDEGTVQFASMLFARGELYSQADSSSYLELAPLPDYIVFINSPWQVGLQRIVGRGHVPVPDRSIAERREFARATHEILASICQLPTIQSRVCQVDNLANDEKDEDQIANEIVQQIVGWTEDTVWRNGAPELAQAIGCRKDVPRLKTHC